MSDFQIGTQYGVAKNDKTGRDPNATVYAGTHGFVTPEKYQELVDDDLLGRGEQARDQVLATLGGGIQNAYETVVPNGIRESINTNALNAWNVTQQVAQGAWEVQPQDHKDFVLASLYVANAPVNAAHWVSKKIDPTGRGLSKNVLGDVEMVLPFAGAAKNIVKGGLKKTLGKIDDIGQAALKHKQNLGLVADLVPVNGGKLKLNGNGGNGAESLEKLFNQPMHMTADEAATTWGKVTKTPIDELGITSAQKGADHGAMSRIVRYVESGRFNKLDHRNKKTIISSQIENSPIEYLVKYHGGDLLDAESHHILDIDFWGRALDTKNNKAVSTVLWKDGVHTGNAKKNIVWAWAARKGSMDHNTLHALYNKIPSRQAIENYMANGTWYTMKPNAQAKLLREVAYDQHRITNNFMNMKLNFILKEHPELSLLHPEHLKNKIVKNPRKYGEIRVIDPKNPEEVTQLLWTLKYSPHTGRVHPKVREVFGLETPKATAKEYSGSAAQKNFNLRLNHRLNKALKIQK
tara:strand:+ start:348 stop:1907 length:1560 start_codon:yes stop_codon:yes gene_type:complete